MDAAEIRRLKPKLRKYLQEFADCFGRVDTRGHLATYVAGQLSPLDRKSVEPIALAGGSRREPCSSFSIPWPGTTFARTVRQRSRF